MRTEAKRFILVLGFGVLTAAALMVADGSAAAEVPSAEQHFSGSLVNLVAGARRSQPFNLSVDHYSSEADLQRLAGILAAKGPYAVRDALWKSDAGNLKIGGGIGYPVGAVVSRDTPSGRKLWVLMNRPLRGFEVQYATRSSKYPFSVLELTLDGQGKGEGTLIGAAQMRLKGDDLTIVSLGVQPIRALAVRAN